MGVLGSAEIWIFFGGIFVLYFATTWLSPTWRRKYRAARDHAYDKQTQKSNVQAVANGNKPVGAPFGATTHGSSYLSSTSQLIDNNLAEIIEYKPDRTRLFVGIHFDISEAEKKYPPCHVYAPLEGHLLTVAPTRSGKGASYVVPNLLTYKGSMVVNDIKGENADITQRFRKSLGQKIYRFDPYNNTSSDATPDNGIESFRAQWNPLDFINPESQSSDAGTIADMLILEGTGEQVFWISEARNFLIGVVLHVVLEHEKIERNMKTVRELLTQGKIDFEVMLDNMTASKNTDIERAANIFQGYDEKLQSGIKATLNSNMKIWDIKEIQAATSMSSFNFEDLKNECMTIYFCIPAENTEQCETLTRLFFAQAVDAMTRNKSNPELPVVFILDEFPQLGKMKPILSGISVLAGFGVRLWMFAQSLAQIKSTYGDNDTQNILENCSCKSFFGTNDNTAAKEISDMCGMMTVPVESYGKNEKGGLLATDNSKSENLSLIGRPLMSPEDVKDMVNLNAQLVFVQGQKPILAGLVPYYEYQHIFSPEIYDEWQRN